MNRAIAVAATFAAAATAAFALATPITPAQAAVRPEHARPAARAETALPRTLHRVIAGAFGSGTDVTVVHCIQVTGAPTPPRITPDAGRAVRGRHPQAAVGTLLSRPPVVKATYTCTVVVEAKAPAPAPARKKARAVRPGRKGCGFGTAEGARDGSGKEIGCSRMVSTDPGRAIG